MDRLREACERHLEEAERQQRAADQAERWEGRAERARVWIRVFVWWGVGSEGVFLGGVGWCLGPPPKAD